MYDVIVVGVGAIGAATCWQASRRGLNVLAIEQFEITHEMGSHAGQSRIIRKAYFEHADYVPLLHAAYEGWRQIEEESQQQLYWETGITYFGPTHNEMLSGVRKSAQLHQLHVENIKMDEVKNRWPQFNLPSSFECVFEPYSGFITPEKAIRSMVLLAQKKGAEIRTNERVARLQETREGMVIETDKGSYETKKVVVSAGAYTSGLLDISIPLRVTQQLLGWARPPQTGFDLGNLPCWMIAEEGQEGLYYGFPSLNDSFEGPEGMKVAHHMAGKSMNNPLETGFHSGEERAQLMRVLGNYLPSCNSTIHEMKMCRYTYSPDEHFILDSLASFHNNVLIAAGFSGHGFKFAPIVGQILSDLVEKGETKHQIDFLRLSRFR